ncbi:MAG: Cohesin subunit SA-2, partial [Paramarteilia canceri]
SIDANVKNSTALNMEGKVSAMSLDLENQQINDVEEFNILDGKKLFYAITEAKASFTDIVDSWIENYVVEKEKALVSLIQLIICASNNNYTLNSSILGSIGMTEIYTSLTENFADEEIYPLISQQDSEFGANFYEFILKLAKASQHTFIDDDSIISDLLSFLRIASSSNYRPLRHTATFFGLSFATGMLSCLASLAAEICNTSSNGDVTLDSKAISQNDNNDRRILKARFDFLFKEIFALRYRDVSHEIRALCISELGNWMLIYPREIIKDSYLKYIGWLLYDKNSIVRLQCIKSILPLTNSKDSLELIQNFLKRFKERYVQMTHDVNDEVSLNALCSLLNISKLNTNYMDDSDYKHVIVLMTSVNRKISSMAASLALSLNSIKHKKSPKDSEVVSFIAFLCSCCAENTDLQSILLVIDSLNSFFDYSSRWDIYLEMINDSKYTSIDGLLLSVLHAGVCYFIGQNFPISRTEKKSIQSEVSKSLDENRNKFTSTFISNFAILFEKFFAESNQILLVVNMVQYFDIDFLMSTINNDEYVQEMAKMLQQLIEKSHSRILLLSSIRAVHRLTSDDLKSGTNTVIKANILNNVVGKILKSFTRSVHEFISGKNVSENLESMKQFTSSLSIFLKFFDLQEFEIEDILEILAGSLTLDDDRHIEIISNLFECQSNLMLIWINNYSLDKNKLMSQKESQAFFNTKLDKVIHYLTQGKNILTTIKFSHE